MHVNAYLDRIGAARPSKPDLESLKRLHRAHLLAIPFEDLDVQLGRRIAIDPVSIYRKIVENKRGGWCYEMNGLFGWALGELGYRVTRLAGAVGREAYGEASLASHLVLRIDFEGAVWIADVGFGNGPIAPLEAVPGEYPQHGFRFVLGRADEDWWRLSCYVPGANQAYDVQLSPADENALALKCDWLQTAAESPFVQNAVCQRYTPDGLLVLRGRSLRRISGEHVAEHLVGNADEFVAILARDFALDLPEAAILWPKICARHEAVLAAKNSAA
jgi:N-hydroxyarylamine O-acetyltransferase